MKRLWTSPTLIAIALAILVPMVGHSVTHAAQHKHAAAQHRSRTGPAAQARTLDLNRASLAELARLPGIGIGLASRIAAARPFRSRDELVDREILTRARYLRIRAMVSVAPVSYESEAAPEPRTETREPSSGGTEQRIAR